MLVISIKIKDYFVFLVLKSQSKKLNLATIRRDGTDEDFELRQTKRQRIAEWLEQRSKTPNQEISEKNEISAFENSSEPNRNTNVKINPNFEDINESGNFFLPCASAEICSGGHSGKNEIILCNS